MRESTGIFLEATPRDIDVEKMLADLHKIEGVKELHHLHLWAIASGKYAMGACVLIDDLFSGDELVKESAS